MKFVFYFLYFLCSIFFIKKSSMDNICSYPCNYFWVWFTLFKLAYWCVSFVWCKLWVTTKFQFVTNANQLQLYHYQLYTYQHDIKVVTTTTYQWTHNMVTNENSFRKRSLRLESSMYILLRCLSQWHKQWHGTHVFHFLDIKKKFNRCDICINTYKFCLIAIITSCLYYLLHALNVNIVLILCGNFHWNTSLKHIAMLNYCIKKKFKNIKFNVKYLHNNHKINISFFLMILQYPHLKNRMLAGFFG
jgi:hypothetical protein